MTYLANRVPQSPEHNAFVVLKRDEIRKLQRERAAIRFALAAFGFAVAALIVWSAAGGIAGTVTPRVL